MRVNTVIRLSFEGMLLWEVALILRSRATSTESFPSQSKRIKCKPATHAYDKNNIHWYKYELHRIEMWDTSDQRYPMLNC